MKAVAIGSCAIAIALAWPTAAPSQELFRIQTEKPDIDKAPPDVVAPRSTPESLSEKLNKSDGIIKPSPQVDPGIVKPPIRDPGNMPVIPPPGAPGGRRDIDPK